MTEKKEVKQIQYCYSLNGEYYTGQFDTVEELIAEVNTEYPDLDEISIAEFNPELSSRQYINADYLIYQMQEDADCNAGEVAEGWLQDFTQKEADSLEKHIAEWFDTHGYKPNFWTVFNEKTVKLKESEGEDE